MNRLTRGFCFLDDLTDNYERVVYTRANFLVIQPKQSKAVRFYVPPERTKRGTPIGRLLAADKNDPPFGYLTWDDFIDQLISMLNKTRSQRMKNKPTGYQRRKPVLR